MSELTLALLWYFVIGLSVVFYVVLDGFDLGVGILHLFTRKDEERRVFLNAIGPVWDGNEVWLVIVGGALFAGFPEVYATLFSGFYNLCMILLAGLIFRAVAIEFRSKRESMGWRYTWDAIFSIASLIIAFGVGLTMGNLIEGIPLNENRDFIGTFAFFFTPYPVLVGLFTVSLLAMHGSIYLVMKTEKALQARICGWARKAIGIFIFLYLVTTGATWIQMPHMTQKIRDNPFLILFAIVTLLAILNVLREFKKNHYGFAFISSSASIFFLFCLFGMGTFPNLVRSSLDPEHNSLTFFNSAASPLTLRVLLIIVLIGIPLVLAYGTMVYRIFRGKVKIEPTSY